MRVGGKEIRTQSMKDAPTAVGKHYPNNVKLKEKDALYSEKIENPLLTIQPIRLD